jgi:hypothetical protein
LADKCGGVVGEENDLRQQWRKRLTRNFVRALFCGFDDDVPEFACNPPSNTMDSRLPLLTIDDLRAIRSAVPALGMC